MTGNGADAGADGAPPGPHHEKKPRFPTADADYYVRWRTQLRDWVRAKNVTPKLADLILLLPDFVHLLVKLMMDSRVALREKVLIGGAIAYFALPIDLAAEMLLGPIGYIDDILIVLFVVDRIVNRIDHGILKEHWAGDNDLLETIQGAMGALQDFAGPRFSGRFSRLLNWLNAPSKTEPTS